MPVFLEPTQKAVIPSKEVPAKEYPLAWISQIHINWPFGSSGEASVELHPLAADGQFVLYRHEDGTDTVIHGRIPNMLAAMSRCPELAAVMEPLIQAVHAWNKIAVADTIAEEQERLDAIAAEVARLAQIEADRLAAIAALEAQQEADRLAAEAQAAADLEAEKKRLEEYNSPEAVAARKDAAFAIADRLDARAAEIEIAATNAAKDAESPEVVAAVEAERLVSVDRLAKSLASEAAQAKAEAEAARIEAEKL